jgi:ParB-like chromosome segregation protein Spo0J
MKSITVKISEVKSNPNNPRIIKDDKFQKLVKSIKEFPEMLNIRPIVVNADMVVLGGNMRLKACKEAGLKEVAIIKAADLTEDQQKQFIIKDNVGFGEWDWEDLANNWDAEQLTDWGLDIPNFMELPSEDELTADEKKNPPTMKITFESVEDLQQAEIDITELIDRKYKKAFFSVSAGEL